MSLESPKPVFVPTNPQNKNIEKFRQEINRKRNLNLKDYKDLHEYSVNPSTTLDFWQDVWNYVGIKASKVSSVVNTPWCAIDSRLRVPRMWDVDYSHRHGSFQKHD
jgi:hypothetical protein